MAGKKRIRDKIFPVEGRVRCYLRVMNKLTHSLLSVSYLKKQYNLIKEIGWHHTFDEIKRNMVQGTLLQHVTTYDLWIMRNEPGDEKTALKKQPKISIIVLLNNTKLRMLEELADCMLKQTYSNWELCLVDGSHKRNIKFQEVYQKDGRIKYTFIGAIGGSSKIANAALELITGAYLAFLGQGDVLPLFALYEVVKTINQNPDVDFIYSDEDQFADYGGSRFNPYFKSGFGPDTLRASNYMRHFGVYKKTLIDVLGGFDAQYDGAHFYDVLLRMSEKTKKIVHIPKILYHCRKCKEIYIGDGCLTAEVKHDAEKRAIQAHIQRLNMDGAVTDGEVRGTYRIRYEAAGTPKVSIIIPNKDYAATLKVCVSSILKLTTYKNYEIIIVENNSKEESTFKYYKEMDGKENVKIVYYPEKGFNYAAIINYGVMKAGGDYIVQLNNDTRLLTENWLEEMLGFIQREDIGAVGVRMYYDDMTIQHAGIIIGMGGVAGHVFKNVPYHTHGYFSKDAMIQNMSAVTAACIMTSRTIYDEVGFMDEKLQVAFNDVDFCLKIRALGKLIVYNPFVEFIHYESKSRGYEDTLEKQKRFKKEIDYFQSKWKEILAKGDPYYNINLRLDNDQCEIRSDRVT